MALQAGEGCDHYESHQFWDEWENDWTGQMEGEWKTERRSLIVDIDLHRYQCTRCEQIGYYSGAALAYYTEGKKSPGIEGLE